MDVWEVVALSIFASSGEMYSAAGFLVCTHAERADFVVFKVFIYQFELFWCMKEKEDWHAITLREVFRRVSADEKGLSTSEANERLKQYGKNIIQEGKNLRLLLNFLTQFTGLFAILLTVGSILAFIADYLAPNEGYWYIAVALIGVVILNAIFTFIQEYHSERIMASFKNLIPLRVTTLRDGTKKEIPADQIVVGDVIFVQEGDKVPADCRLLEENTLKVDISSLTGESEPQLRKLECTSPKILESRNMIFSGTLVQAGNGKAVAYATGMSTQIGRIATLTKGTQTVETPLRREIGHFSKVISFIAIAIGVVFFIISILLGQGVIGSIIFAMGVIVANVPEGLLPTITLSLSRISKRMAHKNALIRNLESVETLGSTTVICTDKTGTLTQNKITVNSIYLNFTEKNYLEKDIASLKGFKELVTAITLCNNARRHENNKKYVGDPTEIALLHFAKSYEHMDDIQKKHTRIHETPFDSSTRRMITTHKAGSKKIAYLKGAPEVVLEKCTRVLCNGEIQVLHKAKKEKILSEYKTLSSRAERVLACGFKETKTDKAAESDFIFIGLLGMIDPPRPEVAGAIKLCKDAGIKIIMITGDYSITAEAIARKIGLVNHDKANIITGDQLEKTSDKALQKFLKKDNIIFARTLPPQKLRIVQNLQKMGEIVTVTGDGVNDAPALKNADLGVAMGLSGTEVAREASDIVLMDDNFATIVNAIEEGRTVYDNIKKVIMYILTSNVAQLLPFIAFALFRIPLPITVILILAIDLGADILPAIGLGLEKPEAGIMKKKPRARTERLITKMMIVRSYGIIGIIAGMAGFATYFFILLSGGWTFGQQLAFNDPLYLKSVTGYFTAIIICQIANVMVCRTRSQSVFHAGLFSNKFLLVGIALQMVMLWIFLYVPVANTLLGTHPLLLSELIVPLPFMLFIFFADEIRKLFVRKRNQFVERYLTW